MKYLLFGLFIFSSSAFSDGTINTTQITKVLLGPGYGNNVYITAGHERDNKPTCSSLSGHHFIFDGTTEAGKMTLSAVLLAYASQKDVSLRGKGVCTIAGNIEDLRHIFIK